MVLVQYPLEASGEEIARKILELENTAWPQNGGEERFPAAPETHAVSLVLLEGGKAVCHVGIRKCVFSHRGQKYLAYGLSEVVTHPDYQKRGLASGLIGKAADFIRRQCPDLSIFTCEKKRVSFYKRGGWEEIKGACLVGGTKEKPFRSDSLDLVTMAMFLSSKGKEHREEFEGADIVLELGENQLW